MLGVSRCFHLGDFCRAVKKWALEIIIRWWEWQMRRTRTPHEDNSVIQYLRDFFLLTRLCIVALLRRQVRVSIVQDFNENSGQPGQRRSPPPRWLWTTLCGGNSIAKISTWEYHSLQTVHIFIHISLVAQGGAVFHIPTSCSSWSTVVHGVTKLYGPRDIYKLIELILQCSSSFFKQILFVFELPPGITVAQSQIVLLLLLEYVYSFYTDYRHTAVTTDAIFNTAQTDLVGRFQFVKQKIISQLL